jgi:hypothetical protein
MSNKQVGIMKETPIRILLLVLALCAFTKVEAQIGELSRSTPEAEGIPSATISALFDSLLSQPATDIHSVMILRHDKVVAEMYPEPFKAEYKHTMYSCSKDLCQCCYRHCHIGEPSQVDRPCSFLLRCRFAR